MHCWNDGRCINNYCKVLADEWNDPLPHDFLRHPDGAVFNDGQMRADDRQFDILEGMRVSVLGVHLKGISQRTDRCDDSFRRVELFFDQRNNRRQVVYNDCLAPNADERFAVLRRRIVGHSLKLAKIRKWNSRWLVLAHLFENLFAAGHDFFPLLLLTRYHSANELPGASG